MAGVALALAFEALLIAVLLSLGTAKPGEKREDSALVTITPSADEEAPSPEPEPEPVEPQKAATAQPQPQPLPQPQPPEVAKPLPMPPPAAVIPVSPRQMQQADISRQPPVRPAQPAGPVGPPNVARPGDSQRIAGSGPNGEPLYAARWYRPPTDDELAGYLSTASGPGWALINCQTMPQFRVDHCQLVAESPQGSGMGRAVLAAAWQFKVRPPQIGGLPKVGEWVRIRISYEIMRGPAPPPG